MADSLRKGIVDAAAAALAGLVIGSVAVGVKRSLAENLGSGQLSAFVLMPVQEKIQPGHHEGQERHFTLRVISAVADSTDQGDMDKLSDPMLTWAEQKIAALEGTVNILQVEAVQVLWNFEVADSGYVGAAIDFDIEYFTARNDPTVAG